MNPKLQKIITDIERTKAKIAELEARLPELERQKTDLENTEIIKLIRSLDVAPDDLTTFIEAYKKKGAQDQSGGTSYKPTTIIKQEVSDNENE